MQTLKQLVRGLELKHSWLSFLDEGADLDAVFKACLVQFRRPEFTPNKYDIFNYERLLSDCSALLDRCLSYRKEYQELAGQAVKQALDYQLFSRQTPTSEAIEVAAWTSDIKQAEMDAQGVVEVSFRNVVNAHPLAAGLADQAGALITSADQVIRAEKIRTGRVREKWKILRDHQQTLEHLHDTPGHSLNYGDRANRILNFLKEDFEDAAEKALNAQAGIEKVFRLKATRTWMDSDIPLDSLTSYVRQVMRELQASSYFEVEIIAGYTWHLEPQASSPMNDFPPPPSTVLTFSEIVADRLDRLYGMRIKSINATLKLKSMTMDDPKPMEAQELANRTYITANLEIVFSERSPFNLNHVGIVSSEAGFAGPQVTNVPMLGVDVLTPWTISNVKYSSPDASRKDDQIRSLVSSIEFDFTMVASSRMPEI